MVIFLVPNVLVGNAYDGYKNISMRSKASTLEREQFLHTFQAFAWEAFSFFFLFDFSFLFFRCMLY